MITYVATVEVDLTQKELDAFAALAEQMSKDLAQVVRLCMNERCQELLLMFKQKPERKKKSAARPRKRTKSGNVSRKAN